MTPQVGIYRLKTATGRHIRWATQVTFPDGDVIRFIDRFTSKREAIKQAIAHREKLEQEARP